MLRLITVAATIAIGSTALAAQDAQGPSAVQVAATGDLKVVCKYVLTAERSKPFRLCLTKADWKRTRERGGSDANRIECHIDEDPATKLTSYKICQPASAWQQQRQDSRDMVEWIQRQSCVPGAGCH